jgi:NADH-quinone oxidoreductase subunit F
MDLRPIPTAPTDDERAVVDTLLGARRTEHVSPRLALASRHLLLPGLHAIQARFGWVPPGALGYLCERLHVPPAEAYGVATFYALFSLSERPLRALHVCDDVACLARGGDALAASAERAAEALGERGVVHRSPCLGLCERAPAAFVTEAGLEPVEHAIGHASPSECERWLARRGPLEESPRGVSREVVPQRATRPDWPLRLLERAGVSDPTSLDAYRAHGGYRALRVALDRGASFVLRELEESGLVGRGGAAFPTGRKWRAVAAASARAKYVVCNADESEPGTFKDRVLMEEDPFAIVEALTIAGVTVGAELGFVYVRGEYPLAWERMTGAIAAARARGLLGDDVMGRGVRFDLELRKGAGAYICGEETALFASIEGFRGEPRTKPPFPVEAGLFGRPTVVNNVETLVNVPWILLHGASAYRAVGTASSPGTRLFCLSGAVSRAGVYEVPLGATLRDLLDAASPGSGAPSAVLLGGAAGTFVSKAQLDLRLTFEDARAAGATLGSGVVLVLDESVPLGTVLARIARFFRAESCGQCVPCRVGTVRQEELVRDLVKRPSRDKLAVLAELGQAMRDASICGLGQTASSAIESAVANLGALGGASS